MHPGERYTQFPEQVALVVKFDVHVFVPDRVMIRDLTCSTCRTTFGKM